MGKLRRARVCAISEGTNGCGGPGDSAPALKAAYRLRSPEPVFLLLILSFSRATLLVLIKAIFAVIHAVLQAVASTLLAMGSVAVLAVLVVAALGVAIAIGISGFGGARLIRKRRERGDKGAD